MIRNSKVLRLSLKKGWFDMTKALRKKEDYREITPYWCSRLLLFNGVHKTAIFWSSYIFGDFGVARLKELIDDGKAQFKPFLFNVMTMGYPSNKSLEKIVILHHAGIRIGQGEKKLGAKPYVNYFVVKHGYLINNEDFKRIQYG